MPAARAADGYRIASALEMTSFELLMILSLGWPWTSAGGTQISPTASRLAASTAFAFDIRYLLLPISRADRFSHRTLRGRFLAGIQRIACFSGICSTTSFPH